MSRREPGRSGSRRRRSVRSASLALALFLACTACSTADDGGQADDAGQTADLSDSTSVEESPAPYDLAAVTPEEYAAALVASTNAVREDAGLDTLSPSLCAQEQGLVRATDLVDAGGELVHASLDPVTDGCGPVEITGENLSRAAASPQDVVDAWMQSPGHASNILMPAYTSIGIACVPVVDESETEMLCSQIFLGI
ncbi:CAP domain-containing protein [Sanguibacter antarcticus]|uniref:Cysteine-rich secretory protein family protein n=1 Tax=Sanguibacter antarcticus TaxID=372484 RepID=A0A2A9E244_9MICO|nr:CAP domain-containing protein [Sanguibacter antarcticus]PFG32282.1 Cysteine-rich secretory protein family protein [Sanguibacter antarcticus]